MTQILGRVLYDNLCAQSGNAITVSFTEVDGKPADNAFDYFGYTLFEVPASTVDGTVDVTCPDGGDLDSWSCYIDTYSGTGDQKIELLYESTPSTYTLLDTLTTAGGKLTLDDFGSVSVTAGRKIRFRFNTGTTAMTVRQLFAGEKMDFEQGQFSGVTPPNLRYGVKLSNTISQNGKIIGRNIKRINRQMNIDLEHCTALGIVTGKLSLFKVHLLACK